jgi:hypothetical protein
MTLSVKLAKQEQVRLDVIVAAMNAATQSDVIRALINKKFDSLQIEKTLLERRGGHPEYLLEDATVKSDRKKNTKVLSSLPNRFRQK